MKRHTSTSRTLFGLLVVSAMAFSLGCKQPAKKAKAPEADAPANTTAKADTTPAGDTTACDKYKTSFCEAAGGDQSQACQSMSVVSALMPPAACEAGLKDLEYTKKQVAEMGKKCKELEDKLCTDLGEDTATCKMVRERTKMFPPEQCVAMLGQYDKVIAELKAEEEKNKPLSEELRSAIAAKDAASWGPADAKVTIVEFSDFQCPYCTRAAQAVDKVKEAYKGKSVRVVFRHFPLSFHQDAHLTAQASLAANEQGKFWAFHDLVFQNQKALSRADLEKYAQQAGLDMAKFKAALDSGKYKAAVDADLALGGKVYVQGTPTMFINGERVPNPTAFEAIQPMIDSRLK